MNTVVITTGGLGTRLLTCTKDNPKTMLPLYNKSRDRCKDPLLRPLLEQIFENLYDQGFRRFCFIVGAKTKHAILNHMIPDTGYIDLLKKRNNPEDKRFIQVLNRVYKKISKCKVTWIDQPTPMGFGDALLKSKSFIGNRKFLLHAGDMFLPNYDILKQFMNLSESNKNSAGVLLLKKVKKTPRSRQEAPLVYQENGLHTYYTKKFLQYGGTNRRRALPYEFPSIIGFMIDTEFEFQVARLIIEQKLFQNSKFIKNMEINKKNLILK